VPLILDHLFELEFRRIFVLAVFVKNEFLFRFYAPHSWKHCLPSGKKLYIVYSLTSKQHPLSLVACEICVLLINNRCIIIVDQFSRMLSTVDNAAHTNQNCGSPFQALFFDDVSDKMVESNLVTLQKQILISFLR